MPVTPKPPFLPYNKQLKSRAQDLRRNATPAERRLWYDCLRHLPIRFTRQKPLGGYIVDFYCSQAALVVEVDGDSHFMGEAQRYNARRTRSLEALGLRVLRFTNREVMESLDAVCAAIRQAVHENRPWRQGD